MSTRQPPPQSPIPQREIGRTGVLVHPVAIDASVFGWVSGQEDTVRVLDMFAANGGNLVSTADHYAGGRSEIMVGGWVRKNSNRDRVCIATKVGRHPDAPGLSAASIRQAIDASLERLSTRHIDFLSLDGDHPETPAEETLGAVRDAIDAGKVRYLSCAGMSAKQIERYEAAAQADGLPHFSAFFSEYNLMDRATHEREVAPWAGAIGRGAIARLPLASGYLTGQFRTRDDVPESVMFGAAMRHLGGRGNRVLAALDDIAQAHEVTPGHVALAWLLVKPEIAATAVRAKDGEQLQALLGAAELQLTRSDVAALDKASG